MWRGPFGMWGHAQDEEKDGPRRHLLYWRGWLHGIPRALLCRRFGHVPVVDGYGKPGQAWPSGESRCARWVACRRCDARPTWQGNLPPALFPTLGARYTGEWATKLDIDLARRADERNRDAYYAACRAWTPESGDPRPEQPETLLPAWPSTEWRTDPGAVSLDVLLWQKQRSDFPGYGFEFSIGCGERPFKAHLHAGKLGSVYVGFENYGRAFAHRLLGRDMPATRVFGIDLDARHRTLRWDLASRKHEWSSKDPKWMSGSVNFAELALGRYVRTDDVIDRREVVLPLPEGRYPATVELHRTTLRRERLRRVTTSYYADLTPACGVPVPGKGENSYDCGDDAIYSSSAAVSTPEYGSEWVTEAVSGFVNGVLRQRSRYGSGLAYVPADGWPAGRLPA